MAFNNLKWYTGDDVFRSINVFSDLIQIDLEISYFPIFRNHTNFGLLVTDRNGC